MALGFLKRVFSFGKDDKSAATAEQDVAAVADREDTQPVADTAEPSIDPVTAERVFDELLAVVRDSGAAALIATHNPELASRMDEVWHLEAGHLLRHG